MYTDNTVSIARKDTHVANSAHEDDQMRLINITTLKCALNYIQYIQILQSIS